VKIFSAIFVFFLLIAFSIKTFSNKVEKTTKGVNIQYISTFEDLPFPYIVVDQITLEGNKITKSDIIHRELLFKSGDTISISEFERLLSGSRENLLNTSLFNFVELNATLNPFNGSNINIIFIERWYLWPFPTFDIHERMVNTWLEDPSLDRVSYGFYLVLENVRGRMEKVRFNFRAGYNQRYSFSYTIPYLNSNHTLGMTLSSGFVRTREVNFMSLDNKQIFYKNPLEFARTEIYAQTNFTYRKNFYNTHYLNIRYNRLEYADTLLALNPLFINSDEPTVQYIGLKYDYISDFRDIKAYPLIGYFNKLSITQNGLNTFSNDISPMFSLENSHRRYWSIDDRWYFAAGLNAKLSFAKEYPYFLQQGLGYKDDFVRGYEYYVVDAQHFAVLKTNLKYNIIPQRVRRISFIPGNKFGLVHYAMYVNLFADAGYTYDNVFFENNPYTNQFLGSAGLGLDFVTYYDKILRTEFTINRHGEFGVYFHIVAPI
jgi:outer membrane protein assembly factor BamA